jgi:predicted MFS family arabinose efflux permease
MTTLQDVAAPARPRLVTRPLLVRFVSVIGTATSFYLLLSAVPLSARSAGASTGLAGLTTTAAGVLALSLTAAPAAVIAGAAVFGLGFGVTQNVTQTVMYDRVPESAYGASSALWNLAYDGGMGLGAAGFGVLALHTGYPIAFVLVAGVLAAAVLPAVLAAVAGARAPTVRTK